MKINFERAKLLMDIIVAVGQHGPVFGKIAAEADAELKKMMEEEQPKEAPRVIPSRAETVDERIERLKDESIERKI